MALIDCPECNNQISETVKICPHCGYTFDTGEPTKLKEENKKYKFAGYIVAAIIVFFLIKLCAGGNNSQKITTPTQSSTIESGQNTEWSLKFTNEKSARPIIRSLSLTINGIDVSGYYITEVSKTALTGTLLNNQVYLIIPGVAGDTGMRLKGTINNNKLIKGMRELYISNPAGWSKEDLKDFRDGNPDIPFIATKN